MAQCREAAKIAEAEGVTLCLECHRNSYTETKEGALDVMQTVDSPAFRMYWQPNQYRTIEENIERLEWNALAWTPNLGEVNLPNSLKYMGKNVFSRNIALGGFGRGDDKKQLTINFSGTMQDWKNILANSSDDWDGGLKEGTVIYCSNGYFKLEKKNILGTLTWKEYPN